MIDRDKYNKIVRCEEIINEHPEILARINEYGEIEAKKTMTLSPKDRQDGWENKSLSIQFMFSDEALQNNSLILIIQIWRSKKPNTHDRNELNLRFAYNPETQQYEKLKIPINPNELQDMIQLGFSESELIELLDIGVKKIIAALEHPLPTRIQHKVSIHHSYREGEDPQKNDALTLQSAGFDNKQIEQLIPDENLSPQSKVRLTKAWVEAIRSGYIKLNLGENR